MDDCKRIAKLWEEETAGGELTSEQIDLIDSHLEICEECRFELTAFDSLFADAEDGPVPFAGDDISRRRWIDETISKAREHRVASLSDDQGGNRWKALAAAAVIALIGGAAAFFALNPAEHSEPHPAINPVATAPTPAPVAIGRGEILLKSGKVRVHGEDVTPDTTVTLGTTLATGAGSTVVDLTTGIRVTLRPRTSTQVTAMGEDGIELTVKKGKILAMVDPKREGPPFSVASSAGKIMVTGTVFSVDVSGDGTRVGVIRGTVKLNEKGMPPRSMTVGESALMGTEGVSSLSTDEQEAAVGAMKVLDMLSPDAHTLIKLDSLPEGAAVKLDSALLGTTPIFARVRPGHRVAELAMEGRTSVREFLELGRGTEISRVFDLEETPVETAAAMIAPRERQDIDPSDLLAKAQRLRAARDWKGAAQAYQAIVKQYPDTVEGRMSLISLGAIRLDHLGDAAGGLRSYEAYLKVASRGTLAQEAAYGRIRALRKMGRADQERSALEGFLRDFPDALLADAARARLADM